MIPYPEIAARLFNEPLAVHEGKARTILSAIGSRVAGASIVLSEAGAVEAIAHKAFGNGRPSAGRLGDRLGRAYDADGVNPFDVVNGVAVIGIEGTLVHKGGYVGMSSGQTSYQGLQTQVVRAARNPQIRGVVFEVDSFGGEVAGAFETAKMIAELSAVKPTIAILTDHALSAGYLLASAARQIIVPEHGRVGSIGVITFHADWSAALEKEGVKVTILSSGAHKADGNPYEPLPDDVATRIRADLIAMRETFAETVGRHRGKRLTKEQAMATEAADFRGTEAVKLGLADAVGDANAAFAAFLNAI